MAQLRNTQFFTFDLDTWKTRRAVTVGHNRTIELDRDSGVLICRLHGNPVAAFSRKEGGILHMVLNDCGYRTTTTRAAMTDFIRGMGLRGSVSFARGGFRVRIHAEEAHASGANRFGPDQWGFFDFDVTDDSHVLVIELMGF